jgi:hypothetical protein
LICNGFRTLPADYPGPSMADPRTIGNWVGGSTSGVGEERRSGWGGTGS